MLFLVPKQVSKLILITSTTDGMLLKLAMSTALSPHLTAMLGCPDLSKQTHFDCHVRLTECCTKHYHLAFTNHSSLRQILNEIAQHKIRIYEFPESPDDEESRLHKSLRQRVPFAVVGANTVLEVRIDERGEREGGRRG